MKSFRSISLAVFLAIALSGVAQEASAPPRKSPIPDTFTNLQVLPKDITKQQLVQTMRGFAMQTGSRCNFCHVSSDPSDTDGKDLSKFDFASDAKEHKKIARVMMQMVRSINQEFLPRVVAVGEKAEEVGPVTCFTCHQGKKHPVHKMEPPPPPPGAPQTPPLPPPPDKK